MKSIVVLFPYFGKLPAQYGAWRASALGNANIDFMFFTDCDVEPADNIIVHKMEFDDFRKMVQEKFDFPVILDRPYKICDFRPAFAYVLADYVKSYDFWGWGDLDVVYGDIRHFVTDDVLSHHKLISGWGHFTLYHNDDDTNTYFMKEVDGYQSYKDAFTKHESAFFDEYSHKGFGDKWAGCRPEECWREWPFDNVSKPKQAYHFCSLNRGWKQVLFEHVGNKLYMVKYENGELKKKESMYAHFQHRGYMKDTVTDYSHFLVTPDGIMDYPRKCAKLRLRWLSRKRRIRTWRCQFHDYIVWKLNLSHYK
ncbi:MAG: hypothetical protein K5896_03015 [Prevotella sp.]|nr:hypothetical protein [Prevotella sp.]